MSKLKRIGCRKLDIIKQLKGGGLHLEDWPDPTPDIQAVNRRVVRIILERFLVAYFCTN